MFINRKTLKKSFTDFLRILGICEQELIQVKDGQYGSEKKKANETEDGKPVWNGMIGEVIRGVSIQTNHIARPSVLLC